MTISYTWLKDYINTDISAQDASIMLSASGLEVEGMETVETIPGGLKGLVVGQVMECEKHPDADKLKVTKVDIGKTELLQIVCGAPNVNTGQKVIVATVGTKLYPASGETFAIKKSKIRGVESFGMLCAEDEIGIGQSHDGIIVLEKKYKIGTPAAQVYQIESDTVLEIGLTPNRVDAASHFGVARDLAALLTIKNKPVTAKLPETNKFVEGIEKIKVTVENTEAAPRYMGVVMKNIKIAPSPKWLQQRLLAIGINPKNNVVDITNYVLHECGQPLHAFDLQKVTGNEIVVRTASEGTKFTTLDGVERTLNANDLMICNAKEEMCLAGVFGGEKSGVSNTTTEIFLESAYFNPVWVRRSAKKHALSTDSSWRYERGADPEMLPYALKRCANLITEIAGGVVTSEVVDIYPQPLMPFKITANLDKINSLIGKKIPQNTALEILKSLEIKVVAQNGAILELEVPQYRVDVQREADIAEEILRLYGFNNVENPPFIKSIITKPTKTTDKLIEKIATLLVNNGVSEVMSNSLTRASYYENLQDMTLEKCVKIINPLSSELSVMRQTLAFNALETIAMNAARKRNALKIFEVGNCYFFDKNVQGKQIDKYSQNQRLGIAITGLDTENNWNNTPQKTNFFTLKTIAEKIFASLKLNFMEGKLEEGATQDLYEHLAATYTIRGKKLFTIGELKQNLVKQFDIKPLQPVYWMEMDLEQLLKLSETVKIKSKELSKFQPVKRDLSLLVDTASTFAQLREAAIKSEKKLLKEVSIFDLYQGDKLPNGKKSYALSFILEDGTKTLTDQEIEKAMDSITKALESLGAEVRS